MTEGEPASASSESKHFHVDDDQEERDFNDWLKVYQHIEPSSSSSSSSHSATTSTSKKTVPESVVLSRLVQNARTTLEMLSHEQKKQKRRKKPHRETQITELQLLYNDTLALIRWLSQKLSNNHNNNHNKSVKKQQPFKCAL